ncbi:MAG: four helix bundle protein [Parcubacteria group bacterium]|nr:four helix bundle protein [Parcubacteria group bacterium]
MSTVQKFEDLLCWQKARDLVKGIYKALGSCQDYGFRDQIQRAAVSVMSNIAEGFERGTRQEFLNYLYIAKGSAGEVRAQLYVAQDVGYLNIETFKYLNNLAVECSRLLQSFAEKVKINSIRGTQFKHVKKPDWLEEQIKLIDPSLFQRLYGWKYENDGK